MMGSRLHTASFFLMLAICAGRAFAQLPPTANASFSSSTVVSGGSKTTSYTITITNLNSGFEPLSDVHFSNIYPPGLVADQVGIYTCATIQATGGSTASFDAVHFHITATILAGGAYGIPSK